MPPAPANSSTTFNTRETRSNCPVVACWTSIPSRLRITIAALRSLANRPAFGVGWFWFVGTLVPMIGIVQVGEQFIADRYMYVPLVGLAIVVAWGVDAAVSRLVASAYYLLPEARPRVGYPGPPRRVP